MPLLSKKAINSVLTFDFCRRLFFFALGKSVNALPSISVLIPDRTGSTRSHLSWRCFYKQWILVTHGNEVSRSFHPFLLSARLWARATQIGSRFSAYPNHRGWWCPPVLVKAISSAINLSVSRRSCASICRTFSIISGVLLVDGRPERGSSSVVSIPSQKCFNRSKHIFCSWLPSRTPDEHFTRLCSFPQFDVCTLLHCINILQRTKRCL